ncbi:MAG: glycosyltransferase [Cyclobacteriaceae bacterium]
MATELHQITVGIKTFYRTDKLEDTLNALIGKSFSQVIIADDGEIDEAKDLLYDKYAELLPLKVLRLPHDTGLPYGRNRMIEACNTPYFLMLDDDQVIPDNIKVLLDILHGDSELGGVSCFWNEYGHIVCRAHNLHMIHGHLIKDKGRDQIKRTIGQTAYFLMDFIPNSTLYRKECFDEIKWDEAIKIGSEHVDFYMAQKQLGKWKFAVTPDVIIKHYPSIGTGTYEKKFRHQNERIKKYKQYVLKKWQFKDVLNGEGLLMINRGVKKSVIHKIVIGNRLTRIVLLGFFKILESFKLI